jgi:uncharacterized membrane protein
MTKPKTESNRAWLTVDRLSVFTDGVLAIIITILVLGIEVPKRGELGAQGLVAFLLRVEHDVVVYLLTFALIGSFWLQHHVLFHYVIRADRPLFFLNGLFLFLLSLSPFTTALAGEYRHSFIANTIFGLTFVLAGIVLFLMWRYCTAREYFLRKPIDPAVRRSMDRRILVAPAISLVGIGMAMIDFHLSALMYLIIPAFYIKHWVVDTNWQSER